MMRRHRSTKRERERERQAERASPNDCTLVLTKNVCINVQY